MNTHQHFKAKVDGYDIHFMYEKGSGSNPQPLIMTHGWPGSFVEFLKAIDRIAHPEKFGGNAEDAFHRNLSLDPRFRVLVQAEEADQLTRRRRAVGQDDDGESRAFVLCPPRVATMAARFPSGSALKAKAARRCTSTSCSASAAPS